MLDDVSKRNVTENTFPGLHVIPFWGWQVLAWGRITWFWSYRWLELSSSELRWHWRKGKGRLYGRDKKQKGLIVLFLWTPNYWSNANTLMFYPFSFLQLKRWIMGFFNVTSVLLLELPDVLLYWVFIVIVVFLFHCFKYFFAFFYYIFFLNMDLCEKKHPY